VRQRGVRKGVGEKMIRLLILFYLLTWSILTSAQFAKLDTTLINKADVIAVVQVEEVFDKGVCFILKSSFKGEGCNSFCISKGKEKISFEVEKEYLIYAKKEKNCLYNLNDDLRVANNKEMVNDIKYLKQWILCKDEKLKAKYKNSQCQRNLDLVCGCDNVTYGSSCEAAIRGIAIYTKGRCDKDKR
jgi:hypothetical protein